MRKIPTIYVRDWNGDKSRVTKEREPLCDWVFRGEGTATRKRDGAACLFHNCILYARFDAKHGKTPPADFMPAQEPDRETGHWPGWVPVGAKPEYKHHRAALADLEPVEPGTYELCGPKVQGNPEGFDKLMLIRHGTETLDNVPTDFDALADWFKTAKIEGVVWHHADGRMAKIKRRDFGLSWPAKDKEASS